MDKDETDKEKERIAADILNMAQSTLLIHMRFLGAALARLDLVPYAGTIATDAVKIYYNPNHIISLFRSGKKNATRVYLHVVLHCLFLHPFSSADRRMWDLACDMAAEAVICEWALPFTDDGLCDARRQCLQTIQAAAGYLTAEKIYAYLRKGKESEQTLAKWKKLFAADDHSLWWLPVEEEDGAPGRGLPGKSGGGYGENESEEGQARGGLTDDVNGDKDESTEKNGAPGHGLPGGGDGENGSNESKAGQTDGLPGGGCLSDDKLQTEREWKALAERLQTDMETFSKEWTHGSGNLIIGLKEVTREKYDYENFLRKFAVMMEVIKVNADEFDYIFYTLGLNLYGNLPLIEPLEYRDDKRVKELAIAIDTSGSVQGKKVISFLRKTYNILKESESYRSRVNIHIIQCDAQIQKDTKINDVRDIESLFSDFKLAGGGGTDFRPVFRYADKLIEDGEFSNLRGLIYFTDGWGNFPEKKPQYRTAFVFVDDGYNNYDVPPWAIKLVLETKDL